LDSNTLMQRIIDGDELAFRQFFHQYSDRLFKFAITLLNSRQEAEEAVSDVFLNIWQHRQRLDEIKNISTYIYSAVRNTALNYLKKRNASTPTLQLENICASVDLKVISPDDLLISKENLQIIAQAVNSLPPACRMIFKLVKEDGLKYKEVAEILHLSVATINVQMTIALKKISQHIKTTQFIDL